MYKSSHQLDKDQIAYHLREILLLLGEDPDRPGLMETPMRVAKMYEEVYEGIQYSNQEIADMFDKCFEQTDNNALVAVTGIDIFSHCEHHLALMYDMKVHIGYIPNGKVIGISKLGRIADLVSKRLQLQEKIGKDIAEIVGTIVGTSSVAVIITGKHACMSARGIKKPSITKTAYLAGDFITNPSLKTEFYDLIKM